jgi:hypothetical protein
MARARERALVGLALGAAVVWRTNVAIVPVAWALVTWSARRPWVRGPLPRVLAWAAAPVALAALRATLLLGAPSGPATNGGVNFLLAHSDWTEVHMPYTGADEPDSVRVIHFFRNRRRAEEAVYFAKDPVYREAPLYVEAVRSMAAHPGRELRRLPGAWLDGMGLGREGYYPHSFFYAVWIDEDRWMEATRWLLGAAIVVPALVWAASRLGARRRSLPPGESLTLATIAGALVTFTLYLSEPRMRVPFDPAFIVAAVLAWRLLVQRFGRPRTTPSSAVSSAA